MVYAAVEIIALLLLAGLIGIICGFGIGYVRTTTVRRVRRKQKAKAELRNRLFEAQQVISVLERTAATNDTEEEAFTGGVRLSERVARAKANQSDIAESGAKIDSESQTVA